MKKKVGIVFAAIVIAIVVIFGISKTNETKKENMNTADKTKIEQQNKTEEKDNQKKEEKRLDKEKESKKDDYEKKESEKKTAKKNIAEKNQSKEEKKSFNNDTTKGKQNDEYCISSNNDLDKNDKENYTEYSGNKKDDNTKEEKVLSNKENTTSEKNNNKDKKHEVNKEDKENQENDEKKDYHKEELKIDEVIKQAQNIIKSNDTLDDWDIIALKMADSTLDISSIGENGQDYLKNKDMEVRGEAEDYPLTTFSRTILAAMAAGKNPYNYEGHNLVERTKEMVAENGDFINGHIWGIIALEACGEKYDRAAALKYLESEQKKDGGFAIIAGVDKSDQLPDMTAMAVYSMAMAGKDKNYPAVKNALNYLKNSLKYLEENSDKQSVESLAQIVMAVTSVGEDIDDYKINNNNVLEEMMLYKAEDGGFKHIKSGSSNYMSTQQALMASMFNKTGENLFLSLKDKVNLNKIIIDKDKSVYGGKNNSSPEKIKGNIEILANDVTLKNAEVSGTLTVDPGKNGSAYIENVKAKTINVLSGGKNSIHFKNVETELLKVNTDETTRIENKESTKIKRTIISSNAVLDNISGEFGEVELSSKDNTEKTLELRGEFLKPIKIKSKAVIKAEKNSQVSNLIINTENKEKVSISGNFKNVDVENASEVEIESGSKIENLNNNGEAKLNVSEEASVDKINDNNMNNGNGSSGNPTGETGNLTVVGYKRTALSNYTFNINEGDKVADILRRVFDAKGISYRITSHGNYIAMIDGQVEKDIGPLSGWKYSVNGVFPNLGIGEQYVQAGDVIKFIFVNEVFDTVGIDRDAYERNRPKISITGLSPEVTNPNVQFTVSVTDNNDSNIREQEVTLNGSNLCGTDGKYTAVLNEGSNTIRIFAKDSEGFKTEKSFSITYKKQTSGGADPGGNTGDEKEIKLTLKNITASIDLSNGGTIKFESEQESVILVKILLYDEENDLQYINDFKVKKGSSETKLLLNKGKYHGFIKESTSEKVDISQFEVE